MSESDLPTMPLSDLLLLSAEHRPGRIADAAEDALNPLGRIADALETFNALFASVIGVGRATCYPPESTGDIKTEAVNFIRSGEGLRKFTCDADSQESADDE
ncbi:hypothetical protein [Bradyrhizobium sp. AZCC 2289]|uniref:hypothetical protein n=1 Tax=Bradyrhizobium sp. AZCC 2289 TaxID=3117026 RepID=UPI002FF40511